MRLLLPVVLSLLGCPHRRSSAPTEALAVLIDAEGRTVGRLLARPTEGGLALEGRAWGRRADVAWRLELRAGEGCEGHAFSAAGPPWRPPGAGRAAGLDLVVGERGVAAGRSTDAALTLSGVANGVLGRPVLLLPDGPDPVPAACGVLQPPPDDVQRVSGDQPDLTDAWEI